MKGGSKLSGALDARSGRPHVGFVLTTPYQLFHYRAIRRHLGGHVSVYVDVKGGRLRPHQFNDRVVHRS